MISAKSSISLKKQDLSNQKIPIVGINNLYFAHQASAGDTGFNLATLTTPSSSMPSFTQPSQSQLLGANLLFFQKNLILTSSLRGQLIKDLSYQVVSNTQINFLNFTAQSGEIFTGIINSASTNGNRIVSTAISPVTGTLAAGVTDFPVGTPFIAGAFSSAQVGQVMVFLDGVQQYRNTGNSSTTLDGNYYEVDPGSGTSNLIRFNLADPNNARSVTVIYTNAVAEKPDGAQSAQIEAMQGQINQMIPVLADAAGVAQSTFRAAPTYQDLKQFGDTVNTLVTRDNALESPTLQSDVIATRLGQKVYSSGTTYNGGNSPTITLSSGGGTLTSVTYSDFMPYQTQDGNWRMRFSFEVSLSSTTRTGISVAVNGITGITTGGDGQGIVGYADTAGAAMAAARLQSNSNLMTNFHTSATTGIYLFAGDVRLSSKPTWAY